MCLRERKKINNKKMENACTHNIKLKLKVERGRY